MTLRYQIGQMLIMGFSGKIIDEFSSVKDWLINDGLGGVLLFDYDLVNQCPGKNLVDKYQIKNLIAKLHHYANDNKHEKNLPLFVAIDYEGGAVDRLCHVDGCLTTLTPVELAGLPIEQMRVEINQMAKTLKELGFNLNFAPVVDLDLNKEQGIIGKLGRSYSADPHHVIHVAREFVEIFANHGITCCYKHFPGHGSALGDSHEGFVDVTATFQPDELTPYQVLSSEKDLPAMIMTAHVINRQLEPGGLPATLSKTILTDLLRRELKFDGVIISDDLQMRAITNHYSLEETLYLTINAGADMMIFANQLGQITPEEIIDKVEYLVNSNDIPQARIEEAFQRICRLKQKQLSLV
ncbi:glycoside hydrolase family 3 protein [Legionella sp. W10-070]|uniref:glycoside hydrolase family 3 protein n=1 Tax=unclassified Legionella TaxID=2622702 RepID=UPI0024154EA6|nr:glycoside hydrolase family 3 N-terminal domain-containing protein [Legionella sp. W10-070]MDI9818329.1 glycoside hydrolase family 3 N-terminal domain-containing protein [Legionella sp. PL877]